jgi:hypothetical protein
MLAKLHDQPQNGDTDDHTPAQLKPQLAQRAGGSVRNRVFGRWLIHDIGSSLRFSMGNGTSSIAASAYVADNDLKQRCQGQAIRFVVNQNEPRGRSVTSWNSFGYHGHRQDWQLFGSSCRLFYAPRGENPVHPVNSVQVRAQG